MAKLLIIWPAMERSDDFETDYLANHVPLASQLPGGSLYTSRTTDSSTQRVTVISYADKAALKASLASPIGEQCRDDTNRLCAEHQVRPSVHILPD